MTPDREPQLKHVVLLVEDDSLDAQLIQTAIKRTPGEITLIRLEDGDEAVAYLSGGAPFEDRDKYPLPKTMILDIKLPKRSGLEVLQWLRAQNWSIRRLPVMMLTSSKHRKDVDRAFDDGVNAYFVKPETIQELIAMLGEFKKFWLARLEFPHIELESDPGAC